ncbi:MAG: HAMP domain-containing protein [Syntrophaceae bacterium]|nr:HAMP domain-containing protein [Syntrophaceae bacterium]
MARVSGIWEKIKNFREGRYPFSRRPLGLQTRITLLFAVAVVSVIVLFSYVEFRLTAHSQRELWRERTIYVTREVDSKIYSAKDLENAAFLEEEMANWMYARPSIRSIDIFVFHKNTYKIMASSWEGKDLGITHQSLESLRRDMVLSTLVKRDDHLHWEILAPLHVGRKVVGGVRIVTSLEEVETFLANKRTRTILFTLISVAILILILAVFFSRAIHRPIQQLVRAMSEAEAGKLNVAVPVRSRDELGLLTIHFNRMLSRISQFNDELNQKVEAATRELAQRNEELRLANESLFQAQRQLVQAEKLSALGHVAATMAHEIGTPLNSISGYIQLMLAEETGSELMTKRLGIIETQLDRLTQKIRNLLHSTRQPEPHLQPVDVNHVLETVITLTQPGMSLRAVELVCHLSPNLPRVSGDPGLLQQVFLNLVSNSLDAMPRGGVLTLTTAPPAASGQNGHFVEVVVQDTGTGMSPEVKRRALEPFFTTKGPGEGAGLGLSICEDILRSHHGKMEIESLEGKGSTLRVQLPVYSPEGA